MNKITVFLDIDGCLTPGKNLPTNPREMGLLRDKLEALDRYSPIIVTARPGPYAEHIVQLLGLLNGNPTICESGGVIHYFGSNTYREMTNCREKLLVFESALIGRQRELQFVLEDGRRRSICLIPLNGGSIELACAIESCLPANLEMHVSAGGVDIVPSGVSKWLAVSKIAEELKVELESAIAVGDSGSDIPVLESVGFPACPANASKEVKMLVVERGGYIANCHATMGVVEILDYHVHWSGVFAPSD